MLTHAKTNVLHKVFFKVRFVLLDVGQGVLIQISSHGTVLHSLQSLCLEIQQQIVDRLLLL